MSISLPCSLPYPCDCGHTEGCESPHQSHPNLLKLRTGKGEFSGQRIRLILTLAYSSIQSKDVNIPFLALSASKFFSRINNTCPILYIREMQNKTMRSHLILVRMIIIPVRWLLSKETQVTNVRGDMEKREPHTLVQPL